VREGTKQHAKVLTHDWRHKGGDVGQATHNHLNLQQEQQQEPGVGEEGEGVLCYAGLSGTAVLLGHKNSATLKK
jgi:hypothetical protein